MLPRGKIKGQLWFPAKKIDNSYYLGARTYVRKPPFSPLLFRSCFAVGQWLKNGEPGGSWSSDLSFPPRCNHCLLYWKIIVFALLPTGYQKVYNAVIPPVHHGWTNIHKRENLASSFRIREETKFSKILNKSQMRTLMWVSCSIISNRIRKSGEKSPSYVSLPRIFWSTR